MGRLGDFGCCVYPGNLATIMALVPVLAFISIRWLPYVQVRNPCYYYHVHILKKYFPLFEGYFSHFEGYFSLFDGSFSLFEGILYAARDVCHFLKGYFPFLWDICHFLKDCFSIFKR